MPFDAQDPNGDTQTVNQNPDANPNGPQTTQNDLGQTQTVYQLSAPLSSSDLAQMRQSLQKSGTGGDVSVSPDGKTLTIIASKMPSHIWQAIAIAGAIMVGAGVAATLVGGSGAATASAAGAGSIGAGATGSLGGGAAAGAGSVGAGAGAGAGAAATGAGIGLKSILPIASTIGTIASGAAAARATGRDREAQLQAGQDALAQRNAQMNESALENRANLDLQQKQFQLTAPQQRAKNSVRGDAMAGLQDAGVSGPITGTHGQVPQITGGLRPSLLSANSRQLGQNMSRDALMQNMNGADNFTPLPPIQIPSITPLPQSNGLDLGLNLAGAIGTGLGAVGSLYNRSKPNVPQIPGYDPNAFYMGNG